MCFLFLHKKSNAMFGQRNTFIISCELLFNPLSWKAWLVSELVNKRYLGTCLRLEGQMCETAVVARDLCTTAEWKGCRNVCSWNVKDHRSQPAKEAHWLNLIDFSLSFSPTLFLQTFWMEPRRSVSFRSWRVSLTARASWRWITRTVQTHEDSLFISHCFHICVGNGSKKKSTCLNKKPP